MNIFLRTLLLFSVIGFGIAVQAQDNTRFTLVRDVSELNDGDAVVIVLSVMCQSLMTVMPWLLSIPKKVLH